MRRTTVTLCATLTCAISLIAGGGSAVGNGTGFSSIVDVCEAISLDEAAARGERLGWSAAPVDRNWRAALKRQGGSLVQVIGWRRSQREGDGLLSYWVAAGPDAHRACVFTTDQPGLLEALRGRFGAPDTFKNEGDITSAFWQRAGTDVSFTRVGMSSVLNLSRGD